MPIVIFFENHRDPITFQVLTKLAPKLKELGYGIFFDEMPSSASIESNLNEMEKGKNLWSDLREQLLEESIPPIDINKPEDLKNEYFTDPAGSGPKILEFIEKYQAFIEMKPFLLFLKENNIEYRGIDIENVAGTNVDLLLLNEKRDKYMVSNFLDEKKSVYGRVGVAHAPGMHNVMLELLPKEQVDAHCICFYIHSKAPTLKEEKEFHTDKYKYLINIDTTKMELSEVCDLIVNTIQLKNKELETVATLPSPSSSQKLFKEFDPRVKKLFYDTGIDLASLDKYHKNKDHFKKLESLKRYLYNDQAKQTPFLSIENVISLNEEEVLNLEAGYDLIKQGHSTIDQVKKFDREQRTILHSSSDVEEAIEDLAKYKPPEKPSIV